MKSVAFTEKQVPLVTEQAVAALYQQLLITWNKRDAAGMAKLFAEDGQVIGFDGSRLDGRAAIEAMLQYVFANHPTGAYVGKIRHIRFLTSKIAMVDGLVGMVEHGHKDLNPALNAVQTLLAVQVSGHWLAALFQNTPAALHGRPELSEMLTAELRELLHRKPA